MARRIVFKHTDGELAGMHQILGVLDTTKPMPDHMDIVFPDGRRGTARLQRATTILAIYAESPATLRVEDNDDGA